MKVCSNKHCVHQGQLQSLENFSKGRGKDGLSWQCKDCMKVAVKNWYKKNKDKALEQNKKWSRENHDKVKQYRRKSRIKNIESLKVKQRERDQKRRKEQPEKVKEIELRSSRKRLYNGKAYEAHKKRLKKDLHYKIYRYLITIQHNALKRFNGRKNQSTMKAAGCTTAFFIQWIESQFQPGMTWENRGEVWQIDHIRPVASFDLTKQEDQIKCFHYLNQKPLWASDNRAKSDTYDWNPEHEALLLTIKIPVNG